MNEPHNYFELQQNKTNQKLSDLSYKISNIQPFRLLLHSNMNNVALPNICDPPENIQETFCQYQDQVHIFSDCLYASFTLPKQRHIN